MMDKKESVLQKILHALFGTKTKKIFGLVIAAVLLTDPQVTEIVTYVIKELDAEGRIHCRCAEGEEGDYDAEICADGVKVTCNRCGATKLIPTDSMIGAHEFLNADSLELE